MYICIYTYICIHTSHIVADLNLGLSFSTDFDPAAAFSAFSGDMRWNESTTLRGSLSLQIQKFRFKFISNSETFVVPEDRIAANLLIVYHDDTPMTVTALILTSLQVGVLLVCWQLVQALAVLFRLGSVTSERLRTAKGDVTQFAHESRHAVARMRLDGCRSGGGGQPQRLGMLFLVLRNPSSAPCSRLNMRIDIISLCRLVVVFLWPTHSVFCVLVSLCSVTHPAAGNAPQQRQVQVIATGKSAVHVIATGKSAVFAMWHSFLPWNRNGSRPPEATNAADYI